MKVVLMVWEKKLKNVKILFLNSTTFVSVSQKMYDLKLKTLLTVLKLEIR